MTRNSSSIDQTMKPCNQRKSGFGFLKHTIGSYWWLAVVCGIVYFFAGPIFTLLYLNSLNFDTTYSLPEVLLQQNVADIARWMSCEGMIPIYLSAIVLSMILGCVMFAYLQHKRQVNFYHSQPIHRIRLFWNRYAIGFIMNMLLMLIMLVVSMLMIVMYGLGDGLSISGIVHHVWNIFVLSLASYSISVLAGQLTGTVLTHLAMMLVMHFCVPLAAVVFVYMGGIFFATFNYDFPMIALSFSPLCAMFELLSGYNTTYLSHMEAPVIEIAMLVILLVIGVGFAMLSCLLYQKRPSEATGKSLIYSKTEPILKAYLMTIGALGGGFVFYAVGNKGFFYFGVFVFAVLIHMVCQVIIEHDFKAIFHKMRHCVTIVVCIGVLIGVVRFDLLGFDRYLPHPDDVSTVSFQISNLDGYYGSAPIASMDESVKQQAYDLLQPVIVENLYRKSQFDDYQRSYAMNDDANNKFAYIKVIYQLENGRTVKRQYHDVPVNEIQENYATLYNLVAYRESYYGELLQADVDRLVYLGVNGETLYTSSLNARRERTIIYGTAQIYSDSPAITVDSDFVSHMSLPKSNTKEAEQLARTLFCAYQQDLLNRDFATLEQVEEQTIQVQLMDKMDEETASNRSYVTRHIDLPVYASDKQTMAILKQYHLYEPYVNYSYDKALIFRCDETLVADLRNVLNDIPKYQKEGVLSEQDVLEAIATNHAGTLIGKIEGKDAVNAFISESKLKNASTLFTPFDQTHFVLLQYPNDVNGTDAREWRVELFYKNTIPTQYQ